MQHDNGSDPRRGKARAAKSSGAGHQQGTAAHRLDPEGWALASAAARGCRCAPTVVPHTYGPRLVCVTVCHDDDCPVVGEVVA
jgi:hypothetical protein